MGSFLFFRALYFSLIFQLEKHVSNDVWAVILAVMILLSIVELIYVFHDTKTAFNLESELKDKEMIIKDINDSIKIKDANIKTLSWHLEKAESSAYVKELKSRVEGFEKNIVNLRKTITEKNDDIKLIKEKHKKELDRVYLAFSEQEHKGFQ